MGWFIASALMLIPVTVIAQIAVPLSKSIGAMGFWTAALIACAIIQFAFFVVGVARLVRRPHA